MIQYPLARPVLLGAPFQVGLSALAPQHSGPFGPKDSHGGSNRCLNPWLSSSEIFYSATMCPAYLLSTFSSGLLPLITVTVMSRIDWSSNPSGEAFKSISKTDVGNASHMSPLASWLRITLNFGG